MKKLLFVFLLAGAQLAISSCKKKEEPAPTPNQLILGRWDLAKTETVYSPANSQFPDEVRTYSKGDFYTIYGATSATGYAKGVAEATGPYTIANNQITAFPDGVAVQRQIVELSKSQFVTRFTFTAHTNANVDITATRTITLVR